MAGLLAPLNRSAKPTGNGPLLAGRMGLFCFSGDISNSLTSMAGEDVVDPSDESVSEWSDFAAVSVSDRQLFLLGLDPAIIHIGKHR